MTQKEKIKSIVGYEDYKPVLAKRFFDSKVFDCELEEALEQKGINDETEEEFLS